MVAGVQQSDRGIERLPVFFRRFCRVIEDLVGHRSFVRVPSRSEGWLTPRLAPERRELLTRLAGLRRSSRFVHAEDTLGLRYEGNRLATLRQARTADRVRVAFDRSGQSNRYWNHGQELSYFESLDSKPRW